MFKTFSNVRKINNGEEENKCGKKETFRQRK